MAMFNLSHTRILQDSLFEPERHIENIFFHSKQMSFSVDIEVRFTNAHIGLVSWEIFNHCIAIIKDCITAGLV